MAIDGHVIIAGYGVGGRFIAEYLQRQGMPFVIVELNPRTCERQEQLGARVIHGDISQESVLRRAGIDTAHVLALAIPDEQAALRAAELAKRLCPTLHIIGATRHTSAALQALRSGADDVIVAEQVVAREFHRRIAAYLSARGLAQPPQPEDGLPIDALGRA